LLDPGRHHFAQAPVVDRKAAQAGFGNVVADVGAVISHIEKVLSRKSSRFQITTIQPQFQGIQVFFCFYGTFVYTPRPHPIPLSAPEMFEPNRTEFARL
jgi:hypothetical protein